MRTVEIDTGLEMQFGQTAAVAGLLQRRALHDSDGNDEQTATQDDEVETIVLVTPELITARAPLPTRSR